MLELSALNLDTLEPLRRRRQADQLMQESLGLLRQRLAGNLDTHCDETVVAISNLIAIEHGRGNHGLTRLHMQALQKLIQERGGLNAVQSTNPLVANIVFW